MYVIQYLSKITNDTPIYLGKKLIFSVSGKHVCTISLSYQRFVEKLIIHMLHRLIGTNIDQNL